MLKHAGSKNLTIDGERFRYVVTEAGGDTEGSVPLSLIVQHALVNGSRLCVNGLLGQRVPEQESKYYSGRTLKRPIWPKDAERLIRDALSKGWNPRLPGKPFVLQVGELTPQMDTDEQALFKTSFCQKK